MPKFHLILKNPGLQQDECNEGEVYFAGRLTEKVLTSADKVNAIPFKSHAEADTRKQALNESLVGTGHFFQVEEVAA
jgi:hypothetical protein